MQKIYTSILVMTIITYLLIASNVLSDETFAQTRNATPPTSNATPPTSNATPPTSNATQAPIFPSALTKNDTATVINAIFTGYLPHVFIIVIFLVIIIPLVSDMYLAYTRKPKGSTEKVVGMSGLYRALMTFGIILLVGTVIFYLLALITLNIGSSSPVISSLIDLMKSLGTILGTALATIIAFYFGMRGAETAAEKGAAAAKLATDREPPKVLNMLPADGAIKVPVYSLVTATFSEPMSSATINTNTFTVKKDSDATPSITGTVSLGPDGKTAAFDATEDFSPNTKYVATIDTGAKDLAGNALVSTKSWSFTTAAQSDTTPPTVVITNPADGAPGVPVSTDVTATFSEAVQSSTVTTSTFTLKAGTPSISGTVTLSADGKTATFTPSSSLAASTSYAATITTGVKDLAGNAMTAVKSWSFTTISQ